MAFAKKAAQKTPATYAQRKAAEEATEEVIDEVEETEEVADAPQDEVQDEVQDDYEEEPAAPVSRQAPARRSFTNQRQTGASAGAREPGKALRLTGLFEGKREGCFSGKLRAEDAENLANLIQEAQSTNQQIVFFLWENQGNPTFSLTANISAPIQKKSWGNKGGGWNRGQGQGQRQGGNFNRGFRRY